MSTNQATTSATDVATLQLFFFGPGVGESIVLRLPCGQWGVVDCYLSSTSVKGGVVDFLKQKKVERLAFFCLTHPHEDHYLGAHLLLKRYAHSVDRIWRHPGFSKRDLSARMLLGAKIRSRRILTSDPEAELLADGYLKVLRAIDDAKRGLTADTYRRVIAPLSLLKTSTYEISALKPGSALLDDVESRMARMNVNKGYLLLNEEDGAVLNSLSVVLLIEFGQAQIFLLGDSQGAQDSLHPHSAEFAAVKVAHHGSRNGLGADGVGVSKQKTYAIRCGVITPYTRSSLPSPDMIAHYQTMCKELIQTGATSHQRPRRIIPTLKGARLVAVSGPWVGVEITEDGQVRQCLV